MKYNIQFDDCDVLTIKDESRPAPICVGDEILVNAKLYKVHAFIHNLDDGNAWAIVK